MRERVFGKEDVVFEKIQAFTRTLLFVADKVFAGDSRRQRCHIVQNIGLFEWYMAGKP